MIRWAYQVENTSVGEQIEQDHIDKLKLKIKLAEERLVFLKGELAKFQPPRETLRLKRKEQ